MDMVTSLRRVASVTIDRRHNYVDGGLYLARAIGYQAASEGSIQVPWETYFPLSLNRRMTYPRS